MPNPTEPESLWDSAVANKQTNKQQTTQRRKTIKKSPRSSRPFETAFMLFSGAKHKEIRQQLGPLVSKHKASSIAKLVAEAWRNLSKEEHAVWEHLAAQGKKPRPELDTLPREGQDDPKSPRRGPYSAFLSFLKRKRSELKRANPFLSQDDATRVAANLWQDLTPAQRVTYLVQETRALEERKKTFKYGQQDIPDNSLFALRPRALGMLQIGSKTEPVVGEKREYEHMEGCNKKRRLRVVTAAPKAIIPSSSPHEIAMFAVGQGGRSPVAEMELSTIEWRASGEECPVPDLPVSSSQMKPPKGRLTAKSLRLRHRQAGKRKRLAYDEDFTRRTSTEDVSRETDAFQRIKPPTKNAAALAKQEAQRTNNLSARTLALRVEDRLQKWYGYALRHQKRVRLLHEENRCQHGNEHRRSGALGGLNLILERRKEELERLAVTVIERRQIARTERIYGTLFNRTDL